MDQIFIYGEHLANLNQVSIAVSLASLPVESTRIELMQDNSIFVHHKGQERSLRLPAIVAQNTTLKIPPNATKELSFRLPVSDSVRHERFNDEASNSVPWTAESLGSELTISCRSCRTNIIPKAKIKVWKALPSQNWAEMMEFWHCHKPSDNDSVHESPSTKGYGSDNVLSTRQGIGFVDISSLVVSEFDCVDLKVVESGNSFKPQELVCTSCQLNIGAIHDTASGWELYKWSIGVQQPESNEIELPLIENFISALFLTLVESQGIRKLIVHCGCDTDNKALMLQIFNTNVCYTASLFSETPSRAIKIFYKPMLNLQEVLEKQSIAVEDVHLPRNILAILESTIQERNSLLPHSVRTFQEYRVSLLNRFEKGA